MPEARRASVALAALIGLAVGVVLLVAYTLAPDAVDRIVRMCRLPWTVSDLRQTMPLTLLFQLSIALVLGGAAIAVARLIRTLWGSRQILVRLRAAPSRPSAGAASERLAARAAALGLPTVPTVADLDGRPAAFTIGLLRPRIVVARVVVDALADAELDALLLHEAAHACRRDPLRQVAAAFCRDLLFFLPISHALFRLAVEAQERAADDAAAATTGPLEVASALVAFLRLASRRPQVGLAAAAAGADPEARIRRLLDVPVAGRSRRASVSHVAAAAASAVVVLILAWVPARAAEVGVAGCCVATAAGAVLGASC